MKKKTVAVLMTAVMAMGMVSAVSVQAGIEDKTLIVGFDAEYQRKTAPIQIQRRLLLLKKRDWFLSKMFPNM